MGPGLPSNRDISSIIVREQRAWASPWRCRDLQVKKKANCPRGGKVKPSKSHVHLIPRKGSPDPLETLSCVTYGDRRTVLSYLMSMQIPVQGSGQYPVLGDSGHVPCWMPTPCHTHTHTHNHLSQKSDEVATVMTPFDR